MYAALASWVHHAPHGRDGAAHSQILDHHLRAAAAVKQEASGEWESFFFVVAENQKLTALRHKFEGTINQLKDNPSRSHSALPLNRNRN
jgi:hypothetical protein